MVSDLNILVWKWSKIAKQKKCFLLLSDFALQNKVETTLPDGLEASSQRAYRDFGIFLEVFEFLCFGWFFPLKHFFLGFWVFLVHPETTPPDRFETSGRRAYCKFWYISRLFWVFAFLGIFPFKKKPGVGVFLVHLETTLPAWLETSGQRVYRLFWHISRRL